MSITSADNPTGVLAGPGAPVAQFFIPAAASLQERRPRTLKHGDTFAVFDHNGDALCGPGSPEGLFHRDTRYLSHLYLSINGRRPMLLSSTLRDDNATLTCDLTNPDLFDEKGKLILEHDLIHLRRSRFLWKATCYERLTVKNYDERPQHIRIEIAFAADFADLFEVRGTVRGRKGRHLPAVIEQGSILLSYVGLDSKKRLTRLSFDPQPDKFGSDLVVYDLELAQHEIRSLFIEIGCDPAAQTDKPGYRSFFFALRDARRALRAASSRAASITTSNEIFNEAARRSVSDLYMLMTDKPEGPYPYAGIPWFSTVFGRDALITALETLWLDPNIARGVLGHLAANQATEIDPASDAEPGKILHEIRSGEMAELGEVPFRQYYGSIDSTPLFVMLAGEYLKRTGDLATIYPLLPHIEAALTWIDEHGDRDGDGFVEYGRQTEEGLINQAWKDSHDSVFHTDGTLANGPIAIAEVQAYVYGAWQAAAEIFRRLDRPEQATSFMARAEGFRRAFDSTFFDEELGTYVLALDRDKRPCRVRSSNAGHALFTGLAYPDRAERVVRTMMSASSFCGWGIRTIPSTEARYNPMSYHNGSIWPHDNALIASGLARYGFRVEAARIFEGLFTASTYIDLRRLPELFCGLARQRAQGPTFYPVACSPQAWAAAAPLSLLQSCLGLDFDPNALQVSFNEPRLPPFLDEVTLRHLLVGHGSVDVTVRRSGREVVVLVVDRKGDIRVVTTA
ncbi:Amylo-alpha-1,6-glucosidase family protein (plasmid) [Neorhizobium galegae bv. officinalis bv. officinalis str. HAMBI 1141]|uniref:Amylo-alpha-1,6-glucosidase family protein n=1 Tax=Neorhizobium galegae bv. officinalis bv. officinalis str. HAMBI 1141 TaxID=1028801 RepID=A0A068TIL9_NEOGA|nr:MULTISPECIES: amylo-alpha-1,6-glucosidase [Neorhizobium]MCJ9669712.1 amylo-alpha-1,6-glucosidase [Neorhizobium sp. SHOUNA12B]MCJ9746086.1 amylo-alpha-1,6-glucosidase [Neorhizobium sp. SHOUNA12A]CDN57881.1 Amylo-alpha-1,6-glucosidase family protein [Neorhizobium galegae bv. officinalis bv. officinalis str. HAMBI 1141]